MGAKRDLALGHIGAFLFAPWPSHSRSQGWKFTSDQPYADPEKAARKLVEIANAPKGIGQIVNRTLRLSGSLGATRWRMAISNYPLAQLN